MKNLQDLYDYYRQTNPSQGKMKSATTFLIHCCKAMDVSNPEDITSDMYEEIPPAIDEWYKNNETQAIQDKSALAEMIGRYGPRNGWEKPLEILFLSEDENLRQFTLQALEYAGCEDPQQVFHLVERFLNGKHPLMRHVAARVFVRMLCTAHTPFIQEKVKEIVEKGNRPVIDALKKNFQEFIGQRPDTGKTKLCQTYLKWLDENTPLR